MLTHTINYAEMRDRFMQLTARNDMSFIGKNRSTMRYLLDYTWPITSFVGCTISEMQKNILEGYSVPGLDSVDTTVIPVRKRKRLRFNDCEGDFRFDLFEVGDENHFVDWTKRESIPGITVEFSTSFSAHVPQSVISDYQRWILKALITLETAGVDSEIFQVNCGNRFEGSQETLKWRMQVKKMGERCDFNSWSPLFAPGSYRTLGFFTHVLVSDILGYQARESMGTPVNEDCWNVSWNKEMKMIEIGHHARSDKTFPETQMTNQLITALAHARGE